MNRLEKKCFISAAAGHALMFLILFIGPAFFVSREKNEAFKPISVYSAADISKALTQGGTPQNVQAVPLPPPPAPPSNEKPVETTPKPPEIPKHTQPEPDLAPVKPVVKIKPSDHGDEPEPPPKKHVIKINPDELVSSKTAADKIKAQRKADAERARKAADAKQQAEEAKQFGNALKTLKNNLSGSTLVKMPEGIDGGGVATVNYRDLIASKYYNAWNPSFSIGENTPDVTVSITISRDGSVRGHIKRGSGNANMDKSVQNALDAVAFIEPFPLSFKEQEMTLPVIFNLQTKRQ